MNAKKAKLIRKLARVSGKTNKNPYVVITQKPHTGTYFCCKKKIKSSGQAIMLRPDSFRHTVKGMKRIVSETKMNRARLRQLIEQQEFDNRVRQTA